MGKLEEDFIGSVKILRRGQTTEHDLQITSDFDHLDANYCSIGESLDYYERLNRLGSEIKERVLDALNDVVKKPGLVGEFDSEEGWRKSLFRDQKDEGTGFRQMALSLVTGDYTMLADEGLSFSFQVPNWQQTIHFAFDAPATPQSHRWLGDPTALPERIAVVIGKNGSGKSTLLARLARVAFATVTDRQQPPLIDAGALDPLGIGFPRVVSISFCPFDSFRLPGVADRESKQLEKEFTKGEGRFVYIGLRDLVAERPVTKQRRGSSTLEGKKGAQDRQSRTRLKSIERLADDFETYLRRIREKSRADLMEKVCSELVPESRLGSGDGSLQETGSDSQNRQDFLKCSSGHKIVLLTALGLLANIEPRSLVLFDEPETHLHPPLLAALMHSVREILQRFRAFAVVATHSAVVVQETLGRHVVVVRRVGDLTTVSPVTTETFGENIGLIATEVFGLNSEATDFHRVLDVLIKQTDDMESIEKLFLGESMSHQGRGYVLSKIERRKREQ
jgi:predicted ATPase